MESNYERIIIKKYYELTKAFERVSSTSVLTGVTRYELKINNTHFSERKLVLRKCYWEKNITLWMSEWHNGIPHSSVNVAKSAVILFTFTEEICNGECHFLYSGIHSARPWGPVLLQRSRWPLGQIKKSTMTHEDRVSEATLRQGLKVDFWPTL